MLLVNKSKLQGKEKSSQMLNFWDLRIYVLERIPTADLAVGNYIKETAS